LSADELARIESLVQRAIGFDDERGDMVTVVNAPFVRNAIDEPEGAPFWEHPRTKELLRIALGGLAVIALIFTVLRPAFRQLIAPAKPRTTVATLVEDDEEEIPVTLSKPKAKAPAQLDDAADAPMNFDEKLQVARTAVSSDPKRVANVVRSWVEQDG